MMEMSRILEASSAMVLSGEGGKGVMLGFYVCGEMN